MDLLTKIRVAFQSRSIPQDIVKPGAPTSPETSDAEWFTGRTWEDITWQDWERHPDAVYTFTPTAFKYYLPSILSATLSAPNNDLLASRTLLGMLDRSPEPRYWDDFFGNRLSGLSENEYGALESWIFALSGNSSTYDQDTLTRALETTDLLKKAAGIKG